MSEVDEDFERELAGWSARYAGRPDLEMLRLALVSLERAEIVAVAYHEDVLRRRLAAMPLSDDVREVIRHVACPTLVLWAERDRHFPLAHARRLNAEVPGSTLRILEGAEHWMALERAEEVARESCGS